MDANSKILTMLERQQDMLELIIETQHRHSGKLDSHSEMLDRHSEMFVGINERLDRQQAEFEGIHTDLTGLHTDITGIYTNIEGIHTDLAGLHTKVDINHQLVIAEIRGHKKEMNDKFAELKQDSDKRFDAVEQGLREVKSFSEEYKHATRIVLRQLDITDRDVTKAFQRIEDLEKVLADAPE